MCSDSVNVSPSRVCSVKSGAASRSEAGEAVGVVRAACCGLPHAVNTSAIAMSNRFDIPRHYAEIVDLTQVQIDIVVRLAVAAAVGMLIGIERERSEHAAGLRTHMLVAVGACLFTLVGVFGFDDGDPSRMASQVVTGIGFLGAGAILREGVSIRGLTTAASLWVVAAIGTATALGMFWASGVAAAITVLSLVVLRPLRRRIRDRADA